MVTETMTQNTPDVVLAFDTTGSMYPYLTAVRDQLMRMVEVIRTEADGLRLGMIAFGDHCDADHPYLLRVQPLTSDYAALQSFVEGVEPTGGGDLPEAVEDVLQAAHRQFDWRQDAPKALILVGDAPPHEAHECPYHLDWRAEAKQLVATGTQVYAIQCGNFSGTRKVWQRLANDSNGYYLPLANIADLTDLVLAICMQLAGKLETFANRLEEEGELTASKHRLFALLDRQENEELTLVPAPDGIYRKLTAADEALVQDIVRAAGLPYVRGHAFYRLDKEDRVHGHERFVVEEAATGQVYEGNSVAALMQPPVAPCHGIVYVQTKSYKRRVGPGESILYRLPAAS